MSWHAIVMLAAVVAVSSNDDALGQRRNEFGPMNGKCRDACGPDCPDTCDVEEYNECTEDAKAKRVVTRYTCGTHQGCRDHDDCLDACIAPYEYGNVPGTDFTLADIEFFVGPCQAECHLEALDYASQQYPGEGPSTVHSWANGGGPYDGSDVWEYTRDTRDGPDRIEPCGECESCFGGACLPIDDCEPCNSCGDVHLYTLDGLKFDFQAAGEFTLLANESGSFNVQARQEPFGGASVNTAVAMNVAGTRVGVYVRETLRIDGETVPLAPFQFVDLPGGGQVRRLERAYIVTWPNEARVSVRLRGGHVNVGVVLPGEMTGTVRGILGDFDEDPSNDLFTASGAEVSKPLTYDKLYREYGDSWRISQEESLFDYANGESTATYQLLDFPQQNISLRDLAASDREKAEQVCKEAGVQGEAQLEDCIYDVALTGDDVFAEDNSRAKTLVREVVRVEEDSGKDETTTPPTKDPSEGVEPSDIVLLVPDELFAGFDIEIALDGTTKENDFITVVSPDAPEHELGPRGRVKGSQLSLYLPTTPGQYEMRYVTASSPRKTIARIPVEVRPLEISLEAPDEVAAGAEFEVVARGTLNPNDYVTVVAEGSPEDYVENQARTQIRNGTLGAGLKRTIKLTAPEATGRFEIRYVTHRQPRTSYAATPLAIQ